MPSRVKKSKYVAGLLIGANERGQAAIEYILLLIISVSMVLALIYQVFKPFQKFVDNYMGSYTACLLETGGLPTWDASDADTPTAADMGCEIAEFEKVDGKFGTGSGSSSGGSKSGDSDSSDSSKSSSSSSSDSSSGSSGSNSSYAGSASRNGSRNMRSPRRAAAGIDGGNASGGKVVEIALEGGGSGSFFGGRGGSSYAVRNRKKTTQVNMAGWTESERKKLEKKNDTGRTTTIAGDDFQKPPKKIGVKPPEKKAEVEKEEEPFTVGNFIRYLFIAALIIALVIFIGGQAVSMSKGSES
ncbi:hypothetical protein [Bdellovibrio sp. NC01]|uniref:hypothetical protein n=1 Tax=Bdellovibrio sp. NC01 TaxID=2220073 RepID=UPI00115BB9D0|nr:hypothetical protein [Bdellovibrio sp. NC01]QDK39502.1 hypothetical protein DOE51_18820 [Bdellovibrio sp. NC01]